MRLPTPHKKKEKKTQQTKQRRHKTVYQLTVNHRVDAELYCGLHAPNKSFRA